MSFVLKFTWILVRNSSLHSVYLMTLFNRYATRLSSPPFSLVVPRRIPSISTSLGLAPSFYSSLATYWVCWSIMLGFSLEINLPFCLLKMLSVPVLVNVYTYLPHDENFPNLTSSIESKQFTTLMSTSLIKYESFERRVTSISVAWGSLTGFTSTLFKRKSAFCRRFSREQESTIETEGKCSYACNFSMGNSLAF